MIYFPKFSLFLCPWVAQSEGVTVDLAGETIGVRSEALVNTPLEPRLFVYRRDGSALELLRNEDAREWCERLSQLSPSHSQRHQIGNVAGRQSAGTAPSWVHVTEHECYPDPHSRGARQVNGLLAVPQTLPGSLSLRYCRSPPTDFYQTMCQRSTRNQSRHTDLISYQHPGLDLDLLLRTLSPCLPLARVC